MINSRFQDTVVKGTQSCVYKLLQFQNLVV